MFVLSVMNPRERWDDCRMRLVNKCSNAYVILFTVESFPSVQHCTATLKISAIPLQLTRVEKVLKEKEKEWNAQVCMHI